MFNTKNLANLLNSLLLDTSFKIPCGLVLILGEPSRVHKDVPYVHIPTPLVVVVIVTVEPSSRSTESRLTFLEKQVRKNFADQKLLFTNINQLHKTINDFFERILKIEEWISIKVRPSLILEVVAMQHEPPSLPRAKTMPSSSSKIHLLASMNDFPLWTSLLFFDWWQRGKSVRRV